jgi:hypothetical protein
MANSDYVDLTRMSTVDATVLPCVLASADLVIARWANGDLKVLKGEDTLLSIRASKVARDLAVLDLLVANDTQMQIIAAALLVIDAGNMTEQAGLNLWSMLVTAASAPAAPMLESRPAKAFRPDTATAYPDAAARGQVRLWKQQLAKQYRQFERGYRSVVTKKLLEAFTCKTGTGRRRAFAKLAQGLGSGVTLQGLRLDGRPLAVWSILKPREAVRQDIPDHCVTVNYILGGIFPHGFDGAVSNIAEGLWSLEIFDHALGRIIERQGASLTAIINEAHDNLLRLRAVTVLSNLGESFLVRAGAGGFICRAHTGSDISANNEPMFYVQARTWIADDMLRDNQVMLVPDGTPGERLIDSWLLPKPVRRIARSGGAFVVSPWVEGLPDLLVMPKGRA